MAQLPQIIQLKELIVRGRFVDQLSTEGNGFKASFCNRGMRKRWPRTQSLNQSIIGTLSPVAIHLESAILLQNIRMLVLELTVLCLELLRIEPYLSRPRSQFVASVHFGRYRCMSWESFKSTDELRLERSLFRQRERKNILRNVDAYNPQRAWKYESRRRPDPWTVLLLRGTTQ